MYDWHVLYTSYLECIIAGSAQAFIAEEKEDAEKWRIALAQQEDAIVAALGVTAWRNEHSLRLATVQGK